MKTKTLEQAQNDLFTTWMTEREYKSSSFNLDGILNYKTWESLNPKIMFFLKETADDFLDVRKDPINIRKGNGNHFWWNIVYWKHAINQIYNKNEIDHSLLPFSELHEVKYTNYIIDSIAYVNVKKICENKTSSNDAEILKYAMNDKPFLHEQINLINPDIVFCSKITFKAYKEIFGEELEQINSICYKHNNRLILKFVHPSYFQIKGGKGAHFSSLCKSLDGNGVLSKFNWTKTSIEQPLQE